LLAKFREGTASGGWLTDADSVVRNRAAVVLGFSVSAHGGAVGSKIDINPELQNCAGFAALEHLMAAHADKTHAYLAMLAILVGQPVKELRFCESFNVDQIWTHVFGLALNSSVYEAIRSAEFCYDALIPLLAMIRASIYSGNESLQGWHIGLSISCCANDYIPVSELSQLFFNCSLGGIRARNVFQSNPGRRL
ncbi:hypothetical protein COOONC_24437, partial [Cooperia oncophora]